MKPFGVRLAAGAVTILLGAIMAAQAQKDHQDELQSSWNPLENVNQNASDDAPAPIGLAQWAENASNSDSNSPSPFADVKDAVQLVQHTEEVDGGASNSLAMPSTFSTPDNFGDSPQPESAADTPSPLATMTFPGEAPGESTGEAANDDPGATFANPAAGDLNLPPTQDFALPGADSTGADAANANALQAMAASNELRGGGDDPSAPSMQPNSFMGDFPAQNGAAQSNATQNDSAQDNRGQMLDPRAMQNDMNAEAAARERQQALAAEDQLRAEMAREQQAREDELQRQRLADEMLAREQMAMQQERERQQAAAPQMNQFVGNQNSPQSMDQRGYNDGAYGARQQPTAPPLPAGQPLPDSQYDNRLSNFDDRGYNNSSRQNDLNSRSGFGQQTLKTLPAAHRLSGQAGGTRAEPGERRLEGVQAPSVVIHKRAPGEVKVGKAASFVIQVQNVGSAEALNVRVHDQVPAGMKFQDATPKPQAGTNGELVWQLGTLGVGEERAVTMQLVPVEEGELGSVARVTFEAAASVRTMSTRPELKIVQTAPATVLIGQQLEIEVEVSNPGTGAATGVMLQEDVPELLEHPQGRELDNLIGTLRPGEVRRQMLRLRAVAPGMVRNTIFLRGDDGLEVSHSVNVQIVSPDLQVALAGPGRRFLERQAEYSLEIANAGTAPANNVRITAFLDRGFTFVSTGNAGQYDPSRHAVYWSLDDLPVGSRGQVPLTLLPVQEGARAIRLEAKADMGVTAKNEHQVDVEALSELTFSVADSADPIEIGTDTTYEITVQNQGSRADSNIRVQVQLPPGIELLDAQGAQTDGRGLVAFPPRAQLGANDSMTYQVKVRGVQDGRHKIQAVVVSDQSTQPVTKEESTMVYDDRRPAVARGQNTLPRQRQQYQ